MMILIVGIVIAGLGVGLYISNVMSAAFAGNDKCYDIVLLMSEILFIIGIVLMIFAVGRMFIG